MLERTGQLLGNYRLIRLLGRGGFADVYLGEHIHLNTYAAIKILRTQLAEDGMENFRTEARTLAHLRHPNIVQVLDFGVDDLTPFFVMQYAPNGTLRQRHPRGVPVALNLVVSYVKQVAAALQFAHNQKFIHRDIKPENMLVGEQNQILLSDFGIAVVTASARAENPVLNAGAWSPAGTASYMAPEQIQGKTLPASDQYALATVVYEWLTGAVPFNGPYMEVVAQQISANPAPLRDKVPSLPPDVEQIVLTALNKDPQRRFGRVEVFATALERAAQSDSSPSLSAPASSNGAQRPTITTEVSSMEAALNGPLGRTVLGPTKVTIGRAPDNTIVLSDPRASSHHAEVRPEGAYFSVVDLGSTNGTFVNEQQVFSNAPRLLQPGDALRVGDTKFTFEMTNAPQQSSYSDGSTMRATPPPPPGGPAATPNFSGNTSYGMGNMNYGGQPDYQGTVPAQSSYAPPQPPYASETQMPTYIPPVPGQSGQQPQYTPPEYSPPPVYTPPSQPQQKRSPARAIILAVIALLIILAAAGGFFLYHNNQVAQNNTNATATARTQANNNATSTAQVATQATASANATATAAVTSHYPPFTNVALFDPLANGSGSAQWATGNGCQFSGGSYQVSIARAGFNQYCFAGGTNFSDFAYQVNMTITQGDCGGLIFRASDTSNFYIYEVCQQGQYNAAVEVNGSFTGASNVKSSSAIHKGLNQENTIAVVIQGNTINLYANGQQIDTVTDSTFTQGQVGVFANDVNSTTAVKYSSALVWTSSS